MLVYQDQAGYQTEKLKEDIPTTVRRAQAPLMIRNLTKAEIRASPKIFACLFVANYMVGTYIIVASGNWLT